MYLFPNLDTLLGFMFHMGSIQGLISSWDVSITGSRLKAPNILFLLWSNKYFRIFEMKNGSWISTLTRFCIWKSAIQASRAYVCFIYVKVAEWDVLSASVYFHIMSLAQFYTLASNRFPPVKAWNCLKLQPFVTPEFAKSTPTLTSLPSQTVQYDFSLVSVFITLI